MRKYIFSIMVFLSFFNIGGCIINVNDSGNNENNEEITSDPNANVVQESDSVSIPVQNQIKFKLTNIHGFIIVKGADNLDSVHVKYERFVRASTLERAQDHLNDVEIDIVTDSEMIHIINNFPNSSQNNNDIHYWVKYEVIIPKNWDVEVRSLDSDIKIEDLNGNVIVETVDHGIFIERINGNAELINTNGKIIVKELTGNLDCRGVNGDITVQMTMPNGSSCILENTNGNIDLSIPDITSASVIMRTSNGSVFTENLIFSNLTSTSTFLQGTIGSGSGEIKLETVNNSLFLRGLSN